MLKRLNTKDWVLYLMLSLLILLLILSMVQIDRQWVKLTEMQQTLLAQAQDIRNLRKRANVVVKQSSVKSVETKEATIPVAFQRAEKASQQADFSMGDWNVEAFGLNLKTITPLISSDVYSSNVQSYVLETLLTRNPDTLKWEGLLAKSWQISDDGMIITFKLRENVIFADGEAFDASDVAFSFNFIMTEAIKAPRDRAYLEMIKSVEAKGKYEVVFTYKEPYFEALSLAGTMTILAEHFYQPYLKTPQVFNESKGILFGTGPYRLRDPKSWTPDKDGVELVRNDRYWGPLQPSYNRIFWRIIQNDSARLTTYRNGEIDSYNARPLEYKKLKADSQMMDKSQNFEYLSPNAGYSYIGWNQKKQGKSTIFADKRVRQAMTYLTDRDKIIQDIYLNYAEVAISPFNPRSKQHAPSLQYRKYDLVKAKTLLAEVGYQDRDGDGLLENEAGKPFKFELTYFQDSEDTKRLVLLLKDIYARAGIQLVPKPSEWPVMLESLEKKNFEAITLGWSSGIETDIYQMFHGEQAKTDGDNFISYQNPALDKIIDQARRTVNEAKRMPLWQEAEKIMYEDQPYTFLTRRKTLLFTDKRIHNLEMTKMGLNKGNLPLETYVPSHLQRYKQ